MRLTLALALVLAPLFFGLGIVLPLMRFETLYFFDQSPSLLGVIATLWGGDDRVLALVVGLVSVLFPVAKLLAISAEAVGVARGSGLAMRLLPHLSRWSLMDVVLVALVIVAAKTGGIAQAFSQPEVVNCKIDECGQHDRIKAIGAGKKPEGPRNRCGNKRGEEEGDGVFHASAA